MPARLGLALELSLLLRVGRVTPTGHHGSQGWVFLLSFPFLNKYVSVLLRGEESPSLFSVHIISSLNFSSFL